MKWINLILGGTAGTLSRYLLSGWVYELFGPRFPYGTLVVNLTGCFLIGFLASLGEDKFLLNPNSRLLLMAGFCGAFTTFSTFILETDHLIKGGEMVQALLNILASVILGFFIFRLGSFLARLI